MKVTLKVWRQDGPRAPGAFETHDVDDVSPDMSFLEVFDVLNERLLGQGFKPVMSGEVGERGRFVYFDTHYHPGTVIELSEVLGPKGTMYRMILEALQNWYGKYPVRPFPDLSRL